MRRHNTHACPAMHMVDPCMAERHSKPFYSQRLAVQVSADGAYMLAVCALCLLSAA